MASLRDTMPATAALIDEHRAAWCDTPEALAWFNAQLRAAAQGQPTAYACENGLTFGRQDTRPGVTPIARTKAAQEAEMALKQRGKPGQGAHPEKAAA